MTHKQFLCLTWFGLAAIAGLGYAWAQQAPNALAGCIYTSALPTLSNNQASTLRCDSSGRLVATGGGSGGSPGGSDTQVQFNDGLSFGGNAAFTFNKTTGAITATGAATLGSAILGTPLAVTSGGTGASATATSGRYLKGDGSVWNTSSGSASGTGACGAGEFVNALNSDAAPTCDTPAAGGTPGGADTQVQFNDGGAFGGNAAFVFNKTTGAITATGAIAAGSIVPTTPLVVTSGGTGASTTATSGRYLKGNGTVWGTSTGAASGTGACGAGDFVSTLNADAAPTCTTPAGGTPGGSDTQVQFNDGSAFGGDAQFTFTKTTGAVVIDSSTASSGIGVLTVQNSNLTLSPGFVFKPANGTSTFEINFGNSGGGLQWANAGGGNPLLQLGASFDDFNSTYWSIPGVGSDFYGDLGPGTDNATNIGHASKNVKTIFVYTVQHKAVAIASLPASPVLGMVAAVTDANTPIIGSTVAAGGSAKALVWYNGANWTVTGI